MAETIGDLSVDLRLASAKFEQGVGRVNRRMDGMQRQAEKASRVFQGLLAIGGGAAFGGIIKGSIDTANRLNDLQDRLGVTVEQMSRLEFMTKRTGVPVTALTTGVQRMTRRISEAARGTGEAVDAIKELGLSAEDLNQLSPDQQFYELADALDAIPNQSDKVRLAMKLLDSEGVALLQTMKGGSAAMRELAEESDRTGNTISSSFAEQATQANAAITRMQGAASGLANRFAIELAPSIETTADWLATNADTVKDVTVVIGGLTIGIKALTIAQSTFNMVARANPYVLLATAIGTVVSAVYIANDAFENQASQAVELRNRVDELTETLNGLSVAQLRNEKNDIAVRMEKSAKRARELKRELAPLKELIQNSGQLTAQGGALPIATAEDMLKAKQLKAGIEENTLEAKALAEAYKQAGDRLERMKRIQNNENDRDRRTQREQNARRGPRREVTEADDPLLQMMKAKERGAAIRKQMEDDAAAAYESIRTNLQTQEEAENERYQSRMDRLQMFLEFNRDKQGEINAVMEREQQRHSERMAAIDQARFQQQLQGAQMVFGNLSTLMNTESRKLFEIGKIAAIAEATVSGIEATIHSYKFGAKIGGPALGAAFATTAALATGVKIAQLKSQQFGGGGTVSGGTAGGAGPGVYQPSQPQIPSGPSSAEEERRGVQIIFNGDVNGLDADQIARSIKDHLDSTDFVLVEPTSRNGRALRSAA